MTASGWRRTSPVGSARRSQLAAPLVGVHPSMVTAVHGESVKVSYQFSAAPLRSAPSALRQITQAIEADSSIDARPTLERLGQAMSAEEANVDLPAIDIVGTYAHPYSPLVFTSLQGPIQQQWARAISVQQRMAFWRWRRGRPLSEFVPVSPAWSQAFITGWLVGRFTGEIRTPRVDDIDQRITVFDDGQWVAFPESLFGVQQINRDVVGWGIPAAVLESLALAIAQCNADAELTALRPYVATRRLGEELPVPGSARHPALHPWIVNGVSRSGELPQIVRPTDRVGTVEERLATATDWLQRLRSSVVTKLLPHDMAGAPGRVRSPRSPGTISPGCRGNGRSPSNWSSASTRSSRSCGDRCTAPISSRRFPVASTTSRREGVADACLRGGRAGSPATAAVRGVLHDWSAVDLVERVGVDRRRRRRPSPGCGRRRRRGWQRDADRPGDRPAHRPSIVDSAQPRSDPASRPAGTDRAVRSVDRGRRAPGDRVAAASARTPLVNLLVPVDRLTGVRPGAVFDSQVNVLVQPVDASGPLAATEPLTGTSPTFTMHAAAALATAGGLWTGMQRAPLDDERPWSGVGVAVGRAYFRRLDATPILDRLATEVFGAEGSLPVTRSRVGEPMGVVAPAAQQQAAEAAGYAVLAKHGALTRFRPPPAFQQPVPEKLTFGRAVRLFVFFVGRAIRNAPQSWAQEMIARTRSRIETGATNWLFGDQSRYVVVLTGLQADAMPPAAAIRPRRCNTRPSPCSAGLRPAANPPRSPPPSSGMTRSGPWPRWSTVVSPIRRSACPARALPGW